jgi:alpha-tubulin suppressor-like RCC1 family protein
MKKLTVALMVLVSFILVSCGGGSKGSMPEVGTANVKIRISKDAFRDRTVRTSAADTIKNMIRSKRGSTSDGVSLKYNGVTVGSIILSYQKSGGTIYSDDVYNNVLDETDISLTLELNKTYTFGIEAKSTSNTTLCEGSTTTAINSGTTSITLSCEAVAAGSISGVVASGVPVVGTIFLRDSSTPNNYIVTKPIGANGAYSFDLTGYTAPFFIRAVGTANGKSVELYSAADTGDAVAHVNDYTSLALAIAVGDGTPLSTVFSNPASKMSTIQANIDTAIASVREIFTAFLTEYDPNSDFDPFEGTYVADGSGMDGVLDNIQIVITDTGFVIKDSGGNEIKPASTFSAPNANPIAAGYVADIVAKIDNAAADLTDINAMIQDYYDNTHLRASKADYFTSFTYHDGVEYDDFMTEGFPSGVSSVSEVSVIDKTVVSGVTTEATIYYTVNYLNIVSAAVYADIVKDSGDWKFSGNERKFKMDGMNIYQANIDYENDGLTITADSGIGFMFEDVSAQGIGSFKVSGAGLSAPNCNRQGVGGYYLDTETKNMRTVLDDTAIDDFHYEFNVNGYVTYFIEPHTNDTCSAVLSGASTDFLMRAKVKTNTDMELTPYMYFLYQDFVSSDDLNEVLTTLNPEIETNLYYLDSLFAGSTMVCYDTNSESYVTEGAMYLVSDTASYSFGSTESDLYGTISIADPAYLESCTHTFFSYDSGMSMYMTNVSLTRQPSATAAAAFANLTFDSIKGSNADAVTVTGDLTASVGDISITYYSNPSGYVSSGGMVTPPSSGSVEVILTAVLEYSLAGDYAATTKNFTVTVQSGSQGDDQAIIDAMTVDDILGTNASADYVIFDMEMSPVIGGETVTCEPTPNAYIDDYGAIQMRPLNIEGVMLSVTCSLGSATPVEFPITIGGLHQQRIAAGSHHSFYIDYEGRLYGFGFNESGKLGLGEYAGTYYYEPVVVDDVDIWASAAAGTESSHAIKNDGTLWATGINVYGQLGDDSLPDVDVFTRVGTDSDWVQVSSKTNFAVALKYDGTLWATGNNDFGQLGLTDTATRNVFTQVGSYTDWAYVSAGENHVLAIKTDGTVWAWGDNSHGQLGEDPMMTAMRTTPYQMAGLSNVHQVSAGFAGQSYAIDSGGSLYRWGNDLNGSFMAVTQIIAADTNEDFIKVSAGGEHALAVGENGYLFAMGVNTYGEFGNGETDDTTRVVSPVTSDMGGDWTDVEAGYYHSFGMRADSEFYGWGEVDFGKTGTGLPVDYTYLDTPTLIETPPYAYNYDDTQAPYMIGAGIGHALLSQGLISVWAYGLNDYGQLGDDPGSVSFSIQPRVVFNDNIRVKQLAAGEGFSAVLDIYGNVFYWGKVYDEDTDTSSTSPYYSKLMGVSGDMQVPTEFGPFEQIAAGTNHLLLLDSTGYVYTYGLNDSGQLCSDPSTYSGAGPALGFMDQSTPVVKMFAGSYSSMFIDDSGNAYACGDNNFYQFGTDSSTQFIEFTPMLSGKTWAHLATAGMHTHGIDTDGYLWSWGIETQGEMGLGGIDRTGTEYVPVKVGNGTWATVAAGESHVIGIKADGTLWAWGGNESGQLGLSLAEVPTYANVPIQVTSIDDWVAVFAVGNSTYAVRAGGSIYVAGDNQFGQLMTGDTSDVNTGLTLVTIMTGA